MIGKQDIEKAVTLLTIHNKWRRGAEIPMVDPKELGIAIDTVLEVLRQSKENNPDSFDDYINPPVKDGEYDS